MLLIVPDSPTINSIPEIRAITDLHRVTVLNGVVTAQDLYELVRRHNWDVLHFGTHGNEEQLSLSDGPLLAMDTAQLARLANARLVFFNSCWSGKHAAYAVSHGIPYAIHTNEAIADTAAWKMAVSFYEYLAQERDAGSIDIPLAFQKSDPGDGTFGFSQSIIAQTDMMMVTKELVAMSGEFGKLRQYMLWTWLLFGTAWSIAVAEITAHILRSVR